jgi:hypothetical protein
MFCRCRPIFCFFRPSEVYHAARRRSVCQGVFFADGKLSVRPSGAAGASQGLQKPREGVRPRPPHASSTATPRRGANALTVLEALLSGAFTRRRLATSTFGCDRRTKMRAVHVLGAVSHAFATVAAPQTSIDRRPNPARLRPFRQTVSQLPQSPTARQLRCDGPGRRLVCERGQRR